MNTDALQHIQYFSQLTQAEAARIRSLMQPFLDGDQPISRKALEQLVLVLGEFGARVSVIEQAAEQQLLADNPLNAGPLLFGQMELTGDKIQDDSMLLPEWDDKGSVLRWTTRPDLKLTLPLFRTGNQTLRIYFKAIIKPEYAKTLKISIDGTTVRHRVRNTDKGLCLQCRLPAPRDLALTDINLLLPAVHSPAELGESSDHRVLGIAITGIEVAQQPASVLQRLLGRQASAP